MVTERERQILEWIREDPSISQKEIAERADISRSSVAVHISNLIRKGQILGRQYVLSENPYAVVVGGANMDIAGKPSEPLVPRDSNPGTVRLSAGGAGRNIAHNMALLGCDVKLISAFGDDAHARELMDGCRNVGIDVRGSLVIPGASTSTYLFIMDEDGDMELAISDMDIYEQLLPAHLERKLDIIENAAQRLLDTGLAQVFISLDANGLYCADHERSMTLPIIKSEVVNATGAGDSMMAAIAWAYLGGEGLEGQGLAGLATSSICVEAAATINTEISADTVRKRMATVRPD